MSNSKISMTYKGAEYVVRYLGQVGGCWRVVIHEAHNTSRGYAYADAPTQDALTLEVIEAKLQARLDLDARRAEAK